MKVYDFLGKDNATLAYVKWGNKAIKCASFARQSTITKITHLPLELGNLVLQSKEISS